MAGILICDQIQNSANTLLINSGALAGNTVGTAQLQSGISVAANTITASAMTVGGTAIGAGNSSTMKNRIINGAMVIDQRNAGASVTPVDQQYLVDRWTARLSQASKLTAQQNVGSVTPPVGFTNYEGLTSTSAYSVSSSDYFLFRQIIEGFNIADLGWGTANAKTVTLSFWVRSSLTGTFGGSLQNGPSNRSYPFIYTISSANTWTAISVTVAGDTSGTWATDNSSGIQLNFGLGVGSGFSGTAGSWAGTNYLSTTGATSVVGTNGATFYITGVQLEVGSSATGYEYRQYGQELALCQRYYENSFDIGTAPANNTQNYFQGIMQGINSNTQSFAFKVMKRTAPTITIYSSNQKSSPTNGQWQYLNSSAVWVDSSSTQLNRSAMSQFSMYVNSPALTSGQGTCVAGNWTADSEL